MSDADTFDLSTLKRAVAVLEKNNAPRAGIGYVIHLHWISAAKLQMWFLGADVRYYVTYRERRTMESIFEHECRRFELGRRATHPTAQECFDRATRVR